MREPGENERIVHVVPADDLQPHIESGVECWCKPRVEKHGNYALTVVHNSMDGRELVERHGLH
jgi:hypothetical protein